MAGALLALGLTANGAQIRFTYENPKLQPHKYVLTVGKTAVEVPAQEGSRLD